MNKVISFKRKKRNRLKKARKIKIPEINIDFIKLLLVAFAIISISLGCVVYKLYNNEFITDFIKENVIAKLSQNFLTVFLFTVEFTAFFKILTLFFATNLFGYILSYIPLIIKCFFIGYISSYYYNQYELNGVLFCLIFLYPFLVATTSSLIYLTRESIQIGKYIYNRIINKSTANIFSIRLYFIRCLVVFIFDIILVLINSYAIFAFSKNIIIY